MLLTIFFLKRWGCRGIKNKGTNFYPSKNQREHHRLTSMGLITVLNVHLFYNKTSNHFHGHNFMNVTKEGKQADLR